MHTSVLILNAQIIPGTAQCSVWYSFKQGGDWQLHAVDTALNLTLTYFLENLGT